MKPNRSRMFTVLMAVLVICTAILLGSCASTGGRKDADPEMKSSGQVEQQSTGVDATSGSGTEVQNESVVNGAGSGEKSIASTTGAKPGSKTGEAGSPRGAASIFEALERILPDSLPELNWNRIATVSVGLLMIAMIYGLAFAIGRLPARRRSAAARGGTPRTAEQAGA